MLPFDLCFSLNLDNGSGPYLLLIKGWFQLHTQSNPGVNNLSSYFPGASSQMTRRHPTSSRTPLSAIRHATSAWWRTSVWGEQATPSARPMSPVWNATKCSANGPGPIGEVLQGSNCVYSEAVANCGTGEGSGKGILWLDCCQNKSLRGFCEKMWAWKLRKALKCL